MAADTRPGSFIISLDFELMWGMFDKVDEATYGANIRGVHQVVPELLTLFTEYELHATWATVGMLTASDAHALAHLSPPADSWPDYEHRQLSAYNHLKTNLPIDKPELYFAPQLVSQITRTPHQELASHTFSHYYAREAQSGDPTASFTADTEALARAFAPFGTTPTSIIFPRNQWHEAALKVLRAAGYTAYRGTENHVFYYARTDRAQNHPVVRIGRLIDQYWNITGHHTYPLDASRRHRSGLVNLPSSRFLRPVSKMLWFLEPLRLRRITASMTHAAKHGEVYHLWWHPHNFGARPKANLRFLKKILKHYAYLKERYGMESLTMSEAAHKAQQHTAAGTT